MNFDYIEASIFTCKDSINLSKLDQVSVNKYGYSSYTLRGNYNEMKVIYNSTNNLLILKGSLPYFSEGQNFSNEMQKIQESIYSISDTLDINMFNAEVNKLDAGITFEVVKKPMEYLNTHYSIKGFKQVHYLNTKYFNGKDINLRMYDAGLNIKQKVTKEIREDLQDKKGYNPYYNYLRFESVFKKPKSYFQKPDLTISNIFNPNFIHKCKEEIMNKYKSIKKEGCFDYPKNKRDLTLSVIELLALKEYGLLYGFNPEEVLKSKIKAIPEGILNKEDKKNRLKSLRATLKKINFKEVSDYDLSNEIAKALNI